MLHESKSMSSLVVINEIVALANEHDCAVQSEFNNYMLTAVPGDKPEDILRRYSEWCWQREREYEERKRRESRDAQVLPKIIEHLAAHPGSEIVFQRDKQGRVQMAHVHLGKRVVPTPGDVRFQLDCVDLTDDPGAVVLAALANWTQAGAPPA